MIDRTTRRLGTAVFVALGCAAAAAAEAAPESNAALLTRALVGSARQVIAQAPLTAGTRVRLEASDGSVMSSEVERAVLVALTGRRVEAMLVPRTAAAATPASATPADTIDRPMTLQEAQARQRALAAEAQQRALTEGETVLPQGTPVRAAADAPPLLSVTIHEARVDYPRIYRSGLFGGTHVERRALARISARLERGEPRSVYWIADADTTIEDSVPRADLRALEDQSRPETKATVPPEGWQKIAEPALVVALVVGLVSLFYTNRP